MDSVRIRTCIAILMTAAICRADETPTKTEFVVRPAAEPRNRHYAGNREPLLPSPLVKLPVCAVQPKGWLCKQLELQAAGFHGHLGEISTFLRKHKNAWLSADGQGERGWEEVPYWLKGFGDCAYLLNNEEQINFTKHAKQQNGASQQAQERKLKSKNPPSQNIGLVFPY